MSKTLTAVTDRELADVLVDAQKAGLSLDDADTVASLIRRSDYQHKLTTAAIEAHEAGVLTFDPATVKNWAGDHTELVHVLWAARREQLNLADPLPLATFIHASAYHHDVQVAAVIRADHLRRATPEVPARSLDEHEMRAVQVIDAALDGRCDHCLRPLATDVDWQAYEGGEGKHLCWDENGSCSWSPVVPRSTIIVQALSDAGLLRTPQS